MTDSAPRPDHPIPVPNLTREEKYARFDDIDYGDQDIAQWNALHHLHAMLVSRGRGILDDEEALSDGGREGIQADYSFHQHGPCSIPTATDVALPSIRRR